MALSLLTRRGLTPAAIVAVLVEVREGLDETLAGSGTLWSAIADLALAASAATHLYLSAHLDEEGL